MKTSSGIVAALMVLILSGQERPTRPQASAAARPELTPYSLASTLVQTLSLAAAARDTLAATKSVGNPTRDSLNGIASQRVAINRLTEATSLLVPFRDAPDELVRTAASELSGAYSTIAARLLKGLSVWEELAKAKSIDDVTALVPESSRHAVDIQEAWRLLPLGVAAVTDALIDSERLTDGKPSYLRLTRAERATLNTELTRLFPNVKPEDKGGQAVDVSVNFLRGFLNGAWKSSDET